MHIMILVCNIYYLCIQFLYIYIFYMLRINFSILLLFLLVIPSVVSGNELLSGIKKIAGKYEAEIGVAVIINGKDTLVYNNRIKYPLMSVFKFHQALAVADLLDRNGLSVDSVIHIYRKELRENTYSPLRDKFPEGNINISISELMVYTLQQSDNNACDILFNRILGVRQTDKFIRSFGIDDFCIKWDENDMHENIDRSYGNWTTPLAAAELMELFVTGRAVSGKSFDFIRNTMTGCSTGTGRLPFPLKGKDVVIGHKTGTGDKNSRGEYIGINDIGFVELPDGNRYVIAVFVKDSKEQYDVTESIIANISAIVFDYVNK